MHANVKQCSTQPTRADPRPFLRRPRRVRAGGKTSGPRLSVPVVVVVDVVVGLGEPEPRIVGRLHGARVPRAAVAGPAATPGPHPAPTAAPRASDCPAAQQHQRGHGENQRR